MLSRMMSVVCGLFLVTAVQAAGFSRGQALYENHCMTCHESWAHSREGRKVKSMDDLRQRVTAWSVHSGLGWRDEEIGDVTEYLDEQFYHLESRP